MHFFLIFLAVNEASKLLRKHYKRQLEDDANLDSINEKYRLKRRFYVEPSIVEVTNGMEDFARMDVIQNRQRNVSLKMLLDSYQHNYLIIQGSGGMGKTFVMQQIALQWAKNEIWKDVKLLFLLEFRNFLKWQSLQNSLNKSYHFVFERYSFHEMQKSDQKVVFLLDGLDEFTFFNATNIDKTACNDRSFPQGIYSLFNPHCMLFRRVTVIISGRQTACQELKSSFKTLFIPTIEIVGFNLPQIGEYVRKYFSSTAHVRSLLQIIVKSENLKLMSKVPSILWSLCELHQGKNQLNEIATMTEFYILHLTIFLKKHLKYHGLTHDSIEGVQIYKLPHIQHIVLSLAKIASDMLDNGTTYIDASQATPGIDINLLEKSGIITVHKESNELEFHQLSIQEFLAAIHYHKTVVDVPTFFRNEKVQNSFPYFAGLRGAALSQSKSPKIVIDFVKCLGEHSGTDDGNIVDGGFYRGNLVDLVVYADQFLEILFEYQNGLSPPILGYNDDVFAKRKYLCIQLIPKKGFENILDSLCFNYTGMHCEDIKIFTNITDDVIKYFQIRSGDDIALLRDLDFTYFFNYYQYFSSSMQIYQRLCKSVQSANEKGDEYAANSCRHLEGSAKKECILHIRKTCNKLMNGEFEVSRVISTCQMFDDSFGLCKKFSRTTTRMQKEQQHLLSAANQFKQSCLEKCKQVENGHTYYLNRNPSFFQDHLVYFFKQYGDSCRQSISSLTSDSILSTREVSVIKDYICDIPNLRLYDLPFYEREELQMIVHAIINCSYRNTTTRLSNIIIDFSPEDVFKTNDLIELLLKNLYKIEFGILRIHSASLQAYKILKESLKHKKSGFNLKYLLIVQKQFTRADCHLLLEYIWFVENISVIPFTGCSFDGEILKTCARIFNEATNTKAAVESPLQGIQIGELHIRRTHAKLGWQFYYNEANNKDNIDCSHGNDSYNTLHRIFFANLFMCGFFLVALFFAVQIF